VAYEKESKWLVIGGVVMIILAIIMFSLQYYMITELGSYGGAGTRMGVFGNVFIVIGVIMMIIGEILRRK